MSYAKMFLKSDGRDLGYFHFVSTPHTGDIIAITVNDRPATFCVEGVVHTPVAGKSFNSSAGAVPNIHLIVAQYNVTPAQ